MIITRQNQPKLHRLLFWKYIANNVELREKTIAKLKQPEQYIRYDADFRYIKQNCPSSFQFLFIILCHIDKDWEIRQLDVEYNFLLNSKNYDPACLTTNIDAVETFFYKKDSPLFTTIMMELFDINLTPITFVYCNRLDVNALEKELLEQEPNLWKFIGCENPLTE